MPDHDAIVQQTATGMLNHLIGQSDEHDFSTGDQIRAVSIVLGGVLAMCHLDDDTARKIIVTMGDASIGLAHSFQRDTHS